MELHPNLLGVRPLSPLCAVLFLYVASLLEEEEVLLVVMRRSEEGIISRGPLHDTGLPAWFRAPPPASPRRARRAVEGRGKKIT